jgi:hypothetical protein
MMHDGQGTALKGYRCRVIHHSAFTAHHQRVGGDYKMPGRRAEAIGAGGGLHMGDNERLRLLQHRRARERHERSRRSFA